MRIFSMNLAKKVAIISANVTKGQHRTGTHLGPQFIKEFDNNRLYSELRNLDCEPIDYAEVCDAKIDVDKSYMNIKNYSSVSKTNHDLSQKVTKAIHDGCVTLVLGGDHSIGLGSVHGTLNSSPQKEFGLIWIDAHSDINTPSTSPSGNFHGQPLSFLVKETAKAKQVPKLKELDWIQSRIPAKNIVYLAIRETDPGEVFLLKEHNIRVYTMNDIQEKGLNEVLKETFEHLTTNNGDLLPLHVSVDIDSLDPWYAPATGTPVLGGLTLPQLMMIGNSIHKTNKLQTLDLVEVNPLLGESKMDREKTGFSAIRAILSFFGYTTLGTHSKDFKFPPSE